MLRYAYGRWRRNVFVSVWFETSQNNTAALYLTYLDAMMNRGPTVERSLTHTRRQTVTHCGIECAPCSNLLEMAPIGVFCKEDDVMSAIETVCRFTSNPFLIPLP